MKVQKINCIIQNNDDYKKFDKNYFSIKINIFFLFFRFG